MLEQYLVVLLIKLAVAAALASVLVRAAAFKRMLLREERTLSQLVQFGLGVGRIFGTGGAVLVVTGIYKAVDLGLEGSLLAGMLGGYVTGLLAGILISIPAMLNGECISMLLFAGCGVLGGLLRDLAPDPEEIWRVSILRKATTGTQYAFNFLMLTAVLFAELLRWSAIQVFPKLVFALYNPQATSPWATVPDSRTTVF